MKPRPSVARLARLRKEYRAATDALTQALRDALRPGDVITYTHGSRCCNAIVLCDYEFQNLPYLSSNGGPEIMRVKVKSMKPGYSQGYWLHVSRIVELDP